MLTRFLGGKKNRNIDIIATVTVLSVCGLAVLAGCGGGSDDGGNPTPSPSPSISPSISPSPVISPSPSPSPVVSPSVSPSPATTAKQRAIAANFIPNYIPDPADRYLHWENNKGLRVFVRPSVNNTKDNTPSNIITAGHARGLVEESLKNWGGATDNDFTFTFVDNADDADIEIVFVDQLLKNNGTTGVGVGLTGYQFIFPDNTHPKVGLLKKAVAQIKADQTEGNLYDTTSHEIGHALGIERHSLDSNDLLFATSLPPAIITVRDTNTLFFLYNSSAATGRAAHVTTGNAKVHTAEID